MRRSAERISGVVQHYAWGDTEYIPRLLGKEVDGEPWAELWLGTHPNGPATLAGDTTLEAETGPLPYLLKVLSAAEPLSLQAHPTTAQATDGFARGVYPDSNAKPELLCALTEFEALCGVRSVDATLDLLREFGATQLADIVAADGPGTAMRGLYLGDIDPLPTIASCATSARPEAEWVRRLDERYPGDASVAVTLLLNYVVLQPGEAIHLTAGNLHAYLRGTGVELMGASDNVVRGGLTVKHVDVDELLTVVDPTPLPDPVMHDAAESGRYPLPEAGVTLVRVTADTLHTSTGHELALDMDGGTFYLPPGADFAPSTEAFVVVVSSPA